MRKLKNITLTEKEWKHLKSAYIRFYRKYSKGSCSYCPMGFINILSYRTTKAIPKINIGIWNKKRIKSDKAIPKINVDIWNKKRINSGASCLSFSNYSCICHEFEQFKIPSKEMKCPCNSSLKEKSFVQLEKLVNKLINDEDYKKI
jgi:hypothetical protein